MPVKDKVKVLSGTSYVIPQQESLLGQGAFGQVQKVYDLNRRDLDLAVKIIQKSSKKDLMNAAMKEKNVIERLPYCVNLVNYHKFCLESSNNYYFIMEYCCGGNLFDQLQKGNKIFSEQEIVDFLVQFLNGYRELLNHGIIHRDIKPQNIMIHNGIYKIGDFGMSKVRENPQDFLQFTSSLGSPFYQLDIFQHKEYTQDIDVYSLGIILFQMLYASPNRIKGVEQNIPKFKNQLQPHPLVDLQAVQDKDQFYRKMQKIKDQEEVFAYLDNYIASSLYKRSEEMIKLLKKMLMIDPQERITFQELFQYPLFKEQLDQINNEQYQYNIEVDILDQTFTLPAMKKENSEYEEINNSNIVNIEEIKKQLMQQKIEICEKLQQEPLLENKIHYQQLLSQLLHKCNGNNNYSNSNLDEKNIDLKGDNLLSGIQGNLNDKENDQKIANQNEQQEVQSINNNPKKNCQMQQVEDASQQNQNNNPEQSVQLEIDLKDDPNQEDPSVEALLKQLQEMGQERDSRIQRQFSIKKVIDILLFLREVFTKYKQIAQKLCQSYSIVKSNDKKTETDFTSLFDNMTLFSLLMFKGQILNLKNNYEQILLDQTLFKGQDQKIDYQLYVTDEEVRMFQNSQEKIAFMQVLDRDLMDLQKLLNDLMSKQQFQTIHQTYFQIADSILVVKEYYKEYLFKLIKQGVEEFGFLEENTFLEFKKTLLFLTEIDQHERNSKLYYQNLKFSKGEVQLRFEQIQERNDQAKQLALYCQNYGINLIAYTD